MKASIGKQTLEMSNNNGQWTPEGQTDIQVAEISGNRLLILVNGKPFTAYAEKLDKEEKTVTVQLNGKSIVVKITEPLDELLHSMGMDQSSAKKVKDLKAPMPGLVLSIPVKEGDTIAKGDKLVVLEAMKMENVLKAPGDGVVAKVLVKPGDAVNKNQKLIDFA